MHGRFKSISVKMPFVWALEVHLRRSASGSMAAAMKPLVAFRAALTRAAEAATPRGLL